MLGLSLQLFPYFVCTSCEVYGKTVSGRRGPQCYKGGQILGTGKDFLGNPTILFLKWKLLLKGGGGRERGRNSEIFFERGQLQIKEHI